jgi:hypothetical protein
VTYRRAERPANRPTSTELLDRLDRYERVLSELGGDWSELNNGLSGVVRRRLLMMAHQMDALLRRAGLRPVALEDPTMD